MTNVLSAHTMSQAFPNVRLQRWPMTQSPDMTIFLALPDAEKARRFDAMVRATFSHVDGRDLLDELHPRKELDIKRRVDGSEVWFEGDWLSNLRDERNGGGQWWLPLAES
jgi:hypothetical protein